MAQGAYVPVDESDHVREALIEAERTRTAIGPVSELVAGDLTLGQDNDVCEANIGERLARGERIAGYKVGFTNIAVREKMGLPDSTSPIMASRRRSCCRVPGPRWRRSIFSQSRSFSRRMGAPIAEGRGENALGHPARAVAWLADMLSRRGRALEPGMVVMTGTLTPILPISRGSTYVATFGKLGRIVATFT